MTEEEATLLGWVKKLESFQPAVSATGQPAVSLCRERDNFFWSLLKAFTAVKDRIGAEHVSAVLPNNDGGNLQ